MLETHETDSLIRPWNTGRDPYVQQSEMYQTPTGKSLESVKIGTTKTYTVLKKNNGENVLVHTKGKTGLNRCVGLLVILNAIFKDLLSIKLC